MSRAPFVAALAAGVASAALVGCGINTQKAGSPNVSAPSETSTGTTTSPAAKKLPKRPAGVVAVEGPRQGSLTPIVRNPSSAHVSFANVSDASGVADLCAGRIDVLDISRQLQPSELAACKRAGVELADAPLLVASDAVVIATRNEHDVGGDCLQISTVDQIFKAGSTIDNWSQVGFFNLPLHVTGREDSSPTFQAFAALALHVARNGSLADVRGDYVVRTTDTSVRKEVTNEARRDRILKRYANRLRSLRLARQIAFQESVQAAIRRAKARMLAIFDQENKQRAATKVVLTPEQKLLIERNNLRRIIAAQNAAQARAERNFRFPQLTFLQQRIRRLLNNAIRPGTVGIFRFSYYELFENLLRPMEIWDPATSRSILEHAKGVTVTPARTATATTATTTSTTTTATTTTTTPAKGNVVVNPDTTPWCVFPSQTTITNGSYQLARRIFLYVSKTNIARPEVKAFLRSYLKQAQTLATQQRYVPIDDTTLAQDQSLIDNNGKFVELPSATTTTQTTASAPATPSAGTTTTQTTAPPTQTVPGVSGAAP
jgi:ABC-type phosphate transport system substrate-binding protein